MKTKKSKILLVSLLGVLLLSSSAIASVFYSRGFFDKEMQTADFSEVVSGNIDSDGDGLLDNEENKLGTNIYNKDTDGDGFDDGEEVKLGHDPLRIQVGDNIDTDGDGLTGEDERKYGTNPNLADTDFDGFDDGQEIASGNDPLKANLSDYIALNAVANSIDEVNLNEGETVIEVESEDIQQINYLENALSSDNIYTFQENMVSYINSDGDIEKVSGEIALPEITDESIKIGSSGSDANNNYSNDIKNIFSQNVSVFDNYSENSISVNNEGLDLISEFTLFIQNTAYQIKETEVPNDPELIKLHKNLIAALIQSDGLLQDIKNNSNKSNESATINVMNGFNELTAIMNDVVFGQILTQISDLTA